MKKIISVLLAVILVFNLAVPGFAAENASYSDYIEVTSKTAPLRKGPGKDYAEIATLQQGDSLVLLGYKTNKHGNDWFKVSYGDSVGYLYSEHALTAHIHTYEPIDSGLSVCKCGEYVLDEDSPILRTNAAVATAGSLLSPEVATVLGGLAGVGQSIGAGLSAAFPYVAVFVVGGMLIYMGVSTSGKQVKDVRRIESLDDIKKLLENLDDIGIYFASAFAPGQVPALLIVSEPMDMDEATDYLKKITDDRINAFIANVTGESLVNIWTFEATAAERLCMNFVVNCPSYTYGDSTTEFLHEHDHTYRNYKIYFEHYHIHTGGGKFTLNKVKDIHILFGRPLEKADFA